MRHAASTAKDLQICLHRASIRCFLIHFWLVLLQQSFPVSVLQNVFQTTQQLFSFGLQVVGPVCNPLEEIYTVPAAQSSNCCKQTSFLLPRRNPHWCVPCMLWGNQLTPQANSATTYSTSWYQFFPEISNLTLRTLPMLCLQVGRGYAMPVSQQFVMTLEDLQVLLSSASMMWAAVPRNGCHSCSLPSWCIAWSPSAGRPLPLEKNVSLPWMQLRGFIHHQPTSWPTSFPVRPFPAFPSCWMGY